MKGNFKQWISRTLAGVLLLTGVFAVVPEAAFSAVAAEPETILEAQGVEAPEEIQENVPETGDTLSENTLWIVGDSTACSFLNEDGSYVDANYFYPRYGYGTQVGEYLDKGVTVRNLALSGRSSKSFLTEANYKTLKEGFKAGDVLIIGFGHNDEKLEADRYTNPNGDYKTEGSFAKSLYDNYVKLAEDAGGEAILCTPIVRRFTGDDFKDNDVHITTGSSTYPGGDYPQAIRDLGTATNTPVVDLTALTMEKYRALGAPETLYLHAWLSDSEKSVDNTHLNFYGAHVVAYMLISAIKTQNVTALAAHVDLSKGDPETQKAALLEAAHNKNYVHKDYSNDLPQSEKWADYTAETPYGNFVFKGTVFGDVGGEVKDGIDEETGDPVPYDRFWLGTDEAGRMRIKPKFGQGKIASTSDGIAMYYYRIPAGLEFQFSAKAYINDVEPEPSNNQGAFGLMARDTMYIDTFSKEISDDYVAAGTLYKTICNCFFRQGIQLGGKAKPSKTTAIEKDQTYNLSIAYNGDGYACTFGDEDTQTGGYDFQLTSVDPDYVYIGMFATRFMDVSFYDINLKLQYPIKVIETNKGTISANAGAWAGDKVKLSAVPNPGYKFDRWFVTCDGREIAVSEDGSFDMPGGEVTVEAMFIECPVLSVGETIAPEPDFRYAGDTEDVVWSVDKDHKKYVKVSNGVITASKATESGSPAIVTAATSGDAWKMEITVVDPMKSDAFKPIGDKTAKLGSSKQLKLQVGSKAKKNAGSKDVSVKPSGSALKAGASISWNILDANGDPTDIVSVAVKDEKKYKYTVKAEKPGVAYIQWGAAKEKGGAVQATFVTKVIVTQPVSKVTISLKGAEVTKDSPVITVDIGQNLKFDAFTDSPTDGGKITWSAKGGGVKITKSGMLTATKATKAGKTVILTAKCGGVKSDEIKLTVNETAKYVLFAKQQIVVKKGKDSTVKPKATTFPAGSALTWAIKDAPADKSVTINKTSGEIKVTKDAVPGVYVVTAEFKGASPSEFELIVK